MIRRCLALCMLFCLLLPEFLSAQERWLRGKVVSIGEHEQKKPKVNLTVTMLETGDADNANSLGLFRIFLKNIFKPGEKVTSSSINPTGGSDIRSIERPGYRLTWARSSSKCSFTGKVQIVLDALKNSFAMWRKNLSSR
jgi:hypothetical protein